MKPLNYPRAKWSRSDVLIDARDRGFRDPIVQDLPSWYRVIDVEVPHLESSGGVV